MTSIHRYPRKLRNITSRTRLSVTSCGKPRADHGADEICYERSAIERWFKQGKGTSPSTSIVLASKLLYPAVNLRQMMQGVIDSIIAGDDGGDPRERPGKGSGKGKAKAPLRSASGCAKKMKIPRMG